MYTIRQFPFDKTGQAMSATAEHGSNWPVIYLINSTTDIYIGETTSFERRFREHLRKQTTRFSGFAEIRFAYDGTENKSSILDFESNLIRLYAADGKFEHILNENPGQSQDHDYFQRSLYNAKVQVLWDQLHRCKLTKQNYQSVRNSSLYKFSPFTSLTAEQRNIMKDVLGDFLDTLETGKTGGAVVDGGAGTGKSLVAVKIIDILLNVGLYLSNWKHTKGVYGPEWCSLLSRFERYLTALDRPLRIAYIAPQQSFNADMKKAFGKMPWKGGQSLVHNTSSIVSQYAKLDPFDIILVDETHRLKHRKGMGNEIGLFDESRRRLGLPDDATQLDVILARTKYCCLFYDSRQSVKNSDITKDEIDRALLAIDRPVLRSTLSVQMRCLGGGDYAAFIDDLLSGNPSPHPFENYVFRVYGDVRKMVDDIRSLNKSVDLCRTLSGFAWPWETKKFIRDNKAKLTAMGGVNRGKNATNLLKLGQYDISIDQYRFVWNIRSKGWVTSPGAADEIGCIHTSQGYDLNYCGVILGPDIRYDKERKEIVVEPSHFCDPFYHRHKRSISGKEIRDYVINAYRTMLLRGIYGCFVYAVDDDLREYLKQCEASMRFVGSRQGEVPVQATLEGIPATEPCIFPTPHAPAPDNEPDPGKRFGNTVVRLRRAKGISQEELAFRSGIHRSYIGVIERGEKSPSIDTIMKVAKGLDVSVGELFAAETGNS